METCFSWSLSLSFLLSRHPPPDLHLPSLSAWYSMQCVDIIALYWFSIIFSQLLLGGWRGNGQRSSSHTSALPTRFFFPPASLYHHIYALKTHEHCGFFTTGFKEIPAETERFQRQIKKSHNKDQRHFLSSAIKWYSVTSSLTLGVESQIYY